MQQLGQMREQAQRIIDALPQRPLLEPGRIEQWLDLVGQRDPARLVWHAERLGGLGGSEIGELLAAEIGHHTFDHPADIVAQKLLLKGPTDPTGDTRRGVEMEPLINEKFHAKYGARSDTELLQSLGKTPPPAAHPWCRGFLDDIVWLPGANGEERHIPDYKAPGSGRVKEILQRGVPLAYRAQLHQYRYLVHQTKGVDIHNLLLVVFDCDQWQPFALPVAYDPQLERDLLEVGNMYWHDYVLRGIVPERGPSAGARILADGEISQDVAEEIQQMAITKVICDAGYTQYNAQKDGLGARLAAERAEESVRLEYYGMSVNIETVQQLELVPAVERLRREGIDMSALIKEGYDKYDNEKVRAALEYYLPEEAPRFLSPKREARIQKTRRKHGAQAEYRDHLEQFGREFWPYMRDQVPGLGASPSPYTDQPLTPQGTAAHNGDSVSVNGNEGDGHERVRRTGPTREPQL